MAQLTAAIVSAVMVLGGAAPAPVTTVATPEKAWLCYVLPLRMFCP